jgi:spore coat protein H
VPAPAVQWAPFAPSAAPAQTLLVLQVTTAPAPGGPTIADLDRDTDPARKPHPTVPVILRAADYGQGVTAPNGTIQVRGQFSRLSPQKSYTIKLLDQAPPWQGTHTIQLNKHPYDLTRLRNKLSFDLFAALPELTSLKTAFVQLFIDGKDMGLFTQVEHVGHRYLREHGFGEDAPLYKAERFEFLPDPALKLGTDPGYSQAAFEAILSIGGGGGGGKDHGPLLAMLADLNNPRLAINDVFERHFDRKSYLTWMAVNVLLRNLDTSSQNFYLAYSAGQRRWRFVPWDFDGGWGFYQQPNQAEVVLARWHDGLANWWGAVLHRRFFSEPTNLQQFRERLAQLANEFFTRERIEKLIGSYIPIVAAAIARPPDAPLLPTDPADSTAAAQQWAAEVSRLIEVVPDEAARVEEQLERPMPFFLGVPSIAGGRVTLTWDPSFDLQGDAVHYDVLVARAPDLDQVVYETSGLDTLQLTIPQPFGRGTYYWRVTARDAKDPETNWQFPFDEVVVAGTHHSGMGTFTVL